VGEEYHGEAERRLQDCVLVIGSILMKPILGHDTSYQVPHDTRVVIPRQVDQGYVDFISENLPPLQVRWTFICGSWLYRIKSYSILKRQPSRSRVVPSRQVGSVNTLFWHRMAGILDD